MYTKVSPAHIQNQQQVNVMMMLNEKSGDHQRQWDSSWSWMSVQIWVAILAWNKMAICNRTYGCTIHAAETGGTGYVKPEFLFEFLRLSHTKILFRSFSDRNFTGGYFWEKLGEKENTDSDSRTSERKTPRRTRENSKSRWNNINNIWTLCTHAHLCSRSRIFSLRGATACVQVKKWEINEARPQVSIKYEVYI